MEHRGPIQQFTEVCLACGRNIYATDECVTPVDTFKSKMKRVFGGDRRGEVAKKWIMDVQNGKRPIPPYSGIDMQAEHDNGVSVEILIEVVKGDVPFSWVDEFAPHADLPAAPPTLDLKELALIQRRIGPKWAFEITDKNAHVGRDDLDAEAEIAAALAAEAALVDPPIGEYVFDPPYLLMRLRMLLTGTASPTDKVWAEALRKLLDHLEGEYDR